MEAPATFAEWIAQRSHAADAKTRQRLNILNIRDEKPRESAISDSTDRMSIAADAAIHNRMVEQSRDIDAETHQRLNTLNIRGEKPRESAVSHSTDRLSIIAEAAMRNRMVEHSLDLVFAALADPTRRAMLLALRSGDERTVGDLAAPHAMSLAAAAKHVAVLTRAGLVQRRTVGRRHFCRLDAAALAPVEAWLERSLPALPPDLQQQLSRAAARRLR